jgi:hypothetical protein
VVLLPPQRETGVLAKDMVAKVVHYVLAKPTGAFHTHDHSWKQCSYLEPFRSNRRYTSVHQVLGADPLYFILPRFAWSVDTSLFPTEATTSWETIQPSQAVTMLSPSGSGTNLGSARSGQ